MHTNNNSDNVVRTELTIPFFGKLFVNFSLNSKERDSIVFFENTNNTMQALASSKGLTDEAYNE